MPPIDLGELASRYALGRQIGMRTYLAVDRESNAYVVLRLLGRTRPRARGAVAAGALSRALQSIEDPRLVGVSDAGVIEVTGTPYVVRPFVAGQTVAEAAAQHRLGLPDVVRVGISLGEALETLHEAKLVHGDLKPSNILLTHEGDVRVVDLGAASLGEAGYLLPHSLAPYYRRLRRRSLGESPVRAYRAPELALGKPVEASADIYSAGRILADLAEQYPHVSEPLESVVSELLAEDPQERPPAAELVERLREVDERLEEGGAAVPRRKAHPPERRGGRALNVWFEADEPVPPLLAGRPHTLGLDIGSRRPGAASESFSEPDFGVREELDLLLSLYSDELELESHSLVLRLPRKGSSQACRTKACAAEPGLAKLEVVVSVLPELEILQTLELAFEVQPVLEAVR